MDRADRDGRRGFLLGSLLGAMACARAPGKAAHGPDFAPWALGGPDPDAKRGGVDLKDPFGTGNVGHLIGAEHFAAVEFTPAERSQVLAGIDGQLALVAAVRGVEFADNFPPAHVFDPRLPGVATPARDHFEPAQLRIPSAPTGPERDESLAFAPLTHLSQWLAKAQVTSVELTELYLRRLERIGPKLECTITVMRESALAQARRADAELAAGRRRGPLHGIPWGAKDLFDTRDVRTTWGATPFAQRVATRDAAVVRRLNAAGAVLIAKLSLGALAYGDQWFGGKTKNPWNLAEGSSGSSAGSAAATVAGLVAFALGTETLGSIVSPSSRCGAVGLRPTFGRVSRAGAMVVAWSLDKIGPICRRVEDTALVLVAIDGADPADPSTKGVPLSYRARPPKGMRVVYDPAWFEQADAPQKRARDRLASLGAELVERKFPALPYNALLLNLYAESAAAFEALTLGGLDDQLKWQDDVAWPNTLRMSRLIPAADCVQADRLRRRAMEVMRDYMAGHHAAISPSFAGPMLTVTNYTGHPSLTLPVGFVKARPRDLYGNAVIGPAGEPVGALSRVPTALTFWGPLYDEGSLWNLGRALEAALGVAGERPPTL